MGDEKVLTDVITAMDAIVPSVGEAFARFPLHLRSEWALKQGSLDDAERCFREAHRLFPNPGHPEGMIGDFMQTLARIEMHRGRIDEAIAVYTQIIDQNLGRLENAAAWVMAHAELARLYRQKGMLTEAKRSAGTVVKWWAEGDIAPQVVRDMKKILAEKES